MDTSAIASAATSMAQAKLANAVEIKVLKKSLDLQAQGALQLLQALPPMVRAANPPHLGNHLDAVA